MAKNEPITPPVHVAPPVQTVELAVKRTRGNAETFEVDLPMGETLNDKRLVLALVGANWTGGAFNPEHVVLDEAADQVESITVKEAA